MGEEKVKKWEPGEDHPVAFTKKRPSLSPVGEVCDISSVVDRTIKRIVPETPMAEVYNIFYQLGEKIVLVCEHGQLIGFISKKMFIGQLRQGVIGCTPIVDSMHDAEHISL